MLLFFFSSDRVVATMAIGSALLLGLAMFAHGVDHVLAHTEEDTHDSVAVESHTPDDLTHREDTDDGALDSQPRTDASELTREAVAQVSLIVGVVTAVDVDNSIYIETALGELYHISSSTRTEVYIRSMGGTGRLLTPRPGDSLMLLAQGVTVTPVAVEVREGVADEPRVLAFFIATQDGRKQLSIDRSTPIYRNSERASLGAVRKGDAVVAIQSKEGVLLALDSTGLDDDPVSEVAPAREERQDSEMPMWVWGLAGAVFVLLGLFFVRR